MCQQRAADLQHSVSQVSGDGGTGGGEFPDEGDLAVPVREDIKNNRLYRIQEREKVISIKEGRSDERSFLSDFFSKLYGFVQVYCPTVSFFVLDKNRVYDIRDNILSKKTKIIKKWLI